MITSFLLSVLSSFLSFILGFLPTGVIPVGITTSLNYIVGVMKTFNWFFPLDSLFTVLGIALFFELAVITFHFVEWIYHKIRG